MGKQGKHRKIKKHIGQIQECQLAHKKEKPITRQEEKKINLGKEKQMNLKKVQENLVRIMNRLQN